MRHYNTYSAFLKKKFSKPVLKLPVNAGFKCPNRDGTISSEGCAFCDNSAFSPVARTDAPPIEQLRTSMRKAAGRYAAFIVYLQPYSNTYGGAAHLRSVYEPLVNIPGVVGLNIGTRPDCLSNEVCGYLGDLARRTRLCVELGLQSSHDTTLTLINRGHTYGTFAEAVEKLAAMNIETAAHIILGLPGESAEMMFATAARCAALPLSGVKIHQLMIIRGTPMERMYREGIARALSIEEYAPLLCGFMERLRPDQCVHRIMSDTLKETSLIAPEWSVHKQSSIRFLHEYMERNGVRQGSRYTGR
jgi:radical SAM protein (TIGR01212 family)